jgi:hypothetical protein
MKSMCALLLCAGSLAAQPVTRETTQAFDCYIQTAEARMRTANTFLAADSDRKLEDQLVRGRRIVTAAANPANPHKLPGGMLYDWIGTVFIPGASLDRTIAMLQDYDHRAQYFSEVVSASKLLCRGGTDRFGFSMQLKEPAIIELESDVVWERVDRHRWQCRSYSTKVHEIGKQHNYLLRLNSYWRFAETDQGVFVQGETITLSGEFGSVMRTLGSLAGISPEKSLRKSLEQMRETLLKPALEFPVCPLAANRSGCKVVRRSRHSEPLWTPQLPISISLSSAPGSAAVCALTA